MKLFEIRNLKEDDLGKVPVGDDPGLDNKKPAPANDDEQVDDTTDTTDDTDGEEEPSDTPPSEEEDVGSVSSGLGFEKTKKDKFFAFGRNGPTTFLTKNTEIGDNSITLQYVINPQNGAWSLRAGLEGHSELDMIEISNGANPEALIKNLKKKHKITPLQVQQLLHPPEEHSDVNDETLQTQPSDEEAQ